MLTGEPKCYTLRKESGNIGIIYKLTSPSGKEYVGLTTRTLEERMNEHRNEHTYDKDPKKWNKPLYRAMRKYGFENFKIEKLFDEECTIEELQQKEIYFISLYDTFNNGYNSTLGGEATLGFRFTDEQKKKLSERSKRCWSNEEYKRKVSERMSGKGNHMYGIRGKDAPSARRVRVVELNIDFDTIKECGAYLIENGHVDSISTGNISNACQRKGGFKKGVYKGFHFEYV